MEKESEDHSLKKKYKKTLNKFLSGDDDKYTSSENHTSDYSDVKNSKRSTPRRSRKDSASSQSPRTPSPKKKTRSKERRVSIGDKTEPKIQKPEAPSKTLPLFPAVSSHSHPIIQFRVTNDEPTPPKKNITLSSPDVLERKSARRSQSANDANPQSSISATVLHKNNHYPEPKKPLVRASTHDAVTRNTVSEHNHKTFKVTIIKGTSHSGEILFFKPKNYLSYDLVRSNFKGVEVMDGDIQYYIVYSELGFGLHSAINMMESSLSEERIIEVFKPYFPVVVKSRNYLPSTEVFPSIFQILMYTLYNHLPTDEIL